MTAINSPAVVWDSKAFASIDIASQLTTGESLINCDATKLPASHFPWARSWALHSSPDKSPNTICVYGWRGEWKRVKSLSRVWLFVTPWTAAYQALRSMGFSRQEYWSGLPFPSPGDLPNPGIEPRSPALQTDTLPSEPLGKPLVILTGYLNILLYIFLYFNFLNNLGLRRRKWCVYWMCTVFQV